MRFTPSTIICRGILHSSHSMYLGCSRCCLASDASDDCHSFDYHLCHLALISRFWGPAWKVDGFGGLEGLHWLVGWVCWTWERSIKI